MPPEREHEPSSAAEAPRNNATEPTKPTESEARRATGRLSGDATGIQMLGPDVPPLEVDDDEAVLGDGLYSGAVSRYRVAHLDSATINSSWRSLYAEDLDYVFENGRRYCGSYAQPNDELEQDRLRVVHQVYLHIFDMELTTVPLENPSLILDIGTGTGEWAIGMGEQFPNCEVIGVDISAIQPTAVPHNVFFEVDDCEMEWMRREDSIDLVHLRNMSGAFTDWTFIYQQALTCLKPGGSIEVVDFHEAAGLESFYARFTPESEFHHLARQVEEGTIRAGRLRGTQHMDTQVLSQLGFVDIVVKEHSIPLSPIDNLVGKLWLIACLHGLEAEGLRILTTYMGWDASQARDMLGRVCNEFKALALNPETGKDFRVGLKVLTARKPVVPGHCTVQSVAENAQMVDYPSGDESTIGS